LTRPSRSPLHLGVNVALLDGGKVLLGLREDFEVWCLPGGHVDAGESLAAAARRELLEETGLEARLHSLVGMYSRPGWIGGGFHVALFRGTATGGTLAAQPEEVLDLAWFDVDRLPPALMVGHERRIRDAAAGRHGLVHSSAAFFPFASLAAAFAARDASGLSRSAFYAAHVAAPNREHEEAELAGAGDGA
jgi:8-oxo-dGTP pyrophosphatase MutT (NUDIX family)